MKAQINNAIGVKTMQSIMLEIKASAPRHREAELRRPFAAGELAPGQDGDDLCLAPDGRISENYAQRDKAFSFLPKSRIVGKVGYSLMLNSTASTPARS